MPCRKVAESFGDRRIQSESADVLTAAGQFRGVALDQVDELGERLVALVVCDFVEKDARADPSGG